jgi:hypothetical protein
LVPACCREAYEAAELQASIDKMVDLRVRIALAAREAARGADLRRRSKMTPAEKSAYIRKHTKAAYDKIPW